MVIVAPVRERKLKSHLTNVERGNWMSYRDCEMLPEDIRSSCRLRKCSPNLRVGSERNLDDEGKSYYYVAGRALCSF